MNLQLKVSFLRLLVLQALVSYWSGMGQELEVYYQPVSF